MFTLLRKTALVGLGLTERAREMLDELAKKGEGSQSEEARRLKAFLESAEKGGRELSQKMDDLCKRMVAGLRVPTRADIERLEKDLAELAAQFRRWETSGRR